MPGLIYYDEIKRAMGLPPEAQLVSVEKALRKRRLPFEYGASGVFTTQEAWNRHILGDDYQQKDTETLDFLRE